MKKDEDNTVSLLAHAEPLALTADLVLPDGRPLMPAAAPTEGLVLIGADSGRRVFAELSARMEALPPRFILPIDCSRVWVMDTSYTRESLMRLAQRRAAGEYPDRYFIIIGVGEELEANLHLVLQAKGIVIPCYRAGVSAAPPALPDLLGDIGPEMRETYGLAARWGSITARRLIEHVGEGRLSIAASSNRLTRLAEAGVLAPVETEVVEGGGRQKLFAPVM